VGCLGGGGISDLLNGLFESELDAAEARLNGLFELVNDIFHESAGDAVRVCQGVAALLCWKFFVWFAPRRTVFAGIGR
jgi:hypothetical protein